MNRHAACPLCSEEIQVSGAAEGDRASCPQCAATLGMRPGDEGLQLVPLCGACGEPHEAEDTFCGACGAQLGADQAEGAPVGGRPRPSGPSVATRARQRRVRVAARWILVVAALYIVSGLLAGRALQDLVDAELEKWRPYGPDAEIELMDGEIVTFAEHERQLRGSVHLAYLINFGLAGAMLLIWLWARVAPLPALITALGIYATVIVLNAVLDPATLTRGVIMKVGILAALLSGVRSALAYRDAAAREGSP